MKYFLKSLLGLTVGLSFNNVGSFSANVTKTYYDDRTQEQLVDASYLATNHFNINPNKHVLLLGYDGVQYEKLSSSMMKQSAFNMKYHIQNYETKKGWTSVLWGNILQQEKDIFTLIKSNDSQAQTANITQWMGSEYYNAIYSPETTKNIDFNYDFDKDSTIFDFGTIEKMQSLLNKLVNLTINEINNGDSFIFSYNAFYDHLKHLGFFDFYPVVQYILEQQSKILLNYYQELDPAQWLIINTTDHGRNKAGFNHDDWDPEAHISWTLANHDLNKILGHSYTNFYDIRTVVMKWLSS